MVILIQLKDPNQKIEDSELVSLVNNSFSNPSSFFTPEEALARSENISENSSNINNVQLWQDYLIGAFPYSSGLIPVLRFNSPKERSTRDRNGNPCSDIGAFDLLLKEYEQRNGYDTLFSDSKMKLNGSCIWLFYLSFTSSNLFYADQVLAFAKGTVSTEMVGLTDNFSLLSDPLFGEYDSFFLRRVSQSVIKSPKVEKVVMTFSGGIDRAPGYRTIPK